LSTVTVDGSSNEITAITLAAGGIEGYAIEVAHANNIVAIDPLRAQENKDVFDHQVSLVINNISQPLMEDIEASRSGKVVVIVELVEGRSKLYGGYADSTPEPKGVGMKLTEFPGTNPGDAALGGSTQLTWGTNPNEPGNEKMAHLIASSFNIDTLLTPTS
jgi:hypothetical protein